MVEQLACHQCCQMLVTLRKSVVRYILFVTHQSSIYLVCNTPSVEQSATCKACGPAVTVMQCISEKDFCAN